MRAFWHLVTSPARATKRSSRRWRQSGSSVCPRMTFRLETNSRRRRAAWSRPIRPMGDKLMETVMKLFSTRASVKRSRLETGKRPQQRLAVECLEDRSVPSAYAVIDLGTFGGTESHAFSINEAGQVAGFATTADELPLAFRWDDGHLTELGTLGGLVAIGLGIDDRGRVVGTANTTDPDTVNGGQQNHAFLGDRGVKRDLGTVPGTINSDAWAVNSRGQVAGWSYNLPPDDVDPATHPFNSHPFIWQGGMMNELAMPAGMTNGFAGAINAAGLIAGNGFDGVTLHAIVWRQDHHGGYAPLDIGFPSGTIR